MRIVALVRIVLTLAFAAAAIPAKAQIITTAAGGGPLDGSPATGAALGSVAGLADDGEGGFYVTGGAQGKVFHVDRGGAITLVAGMGRPDVSAGDGGPAREASVLTWGGYGGALATDAAGNVYIGEPGRVRRIDASGIIRTIVGNGTPGSSGDGGPATAAQINEGRGLAVDVQGNLYIADGVGHRVRRISPGGIITTVAGTGVAGYGGDGGPATSALLNEPWALAFDVAGNLYVADRRNHRVRRIDSGGVITTSAGDGTEAGSSSPEFGAATAIALRFPQALDVDASGRLYIGDNVSRVLRVDLDGTIARVAGNGTRAHGGDGGPALSAAFSDPSALVVQSTGGYLIGTFLGRVRHVDASDVIHTVAGNEFADSSGLPGPAAATQISWPAGITFGPDGALYVTARSGNVFRVDASGHTTVFAGVLNLVGQPPAPVTDGVPAPSTNLGLGPWDTTFGPDGSAYVATHDRVRRIDPSGVVTTIAGTGAAGFNGDGLAPLDTQFDGLASILLEPDGRVIVADNGNHRIRRIDPTGTVTTVAGTGVHGFSGDGGPATEAMLGGPRGLAHGPDGLLYFGDADAGRVRRIRADGIVETAALLPYSPVEDLAFDGAGDLYVAQGAAAVVLKVSLASGTSSVVAGTGVVGFSGDGGPATAARLWSPVGIALDGAGHLYIADSFSNRVRKVALGSRPPVAYAGADQTVEATGPDTTVSLEASASSDPDGDPLAFTWRNSGGTVVGTTAVISVKLPIGSHTFSLTVDDGRGLTATDAVVIVIRDTTAPVLASYSPSPSSLVRGLSVVVSGESNEALLSVSVNGTTLGLSADRRSFNGTYLASAYGPATLDIVLTDQAANVTSRRIPVQFVNDAIPVISLTVPATSLANSTTIVLAGTSTAPLASISVSGLSLTVSADQHAFSGTYLVPGDGLYSLDVAGKDALGHAFTQTLTVRVIQSLPPFLTVHSPFTVDLGPGGFGIKLGPEFAGGPSSPGCQVVNSLYEGITLPTIDAAPYSEAFPPGVLPKIPDPNSLTSFLPNGDPENALKKAWMVGCQGYNLMPPMDCQSQRLYFRLITGIYPEEMILQAIPGLSPTLVSFLSPRFNVCTGFDFSNLSCSDLKSVLPLLADIGVPGLGIIMETPLAQAATEAVLCSKFDCTNPLLANTLVCRGISLPPLPNLPAPGIPGGFALPAGFGGGGTYFSQAGSGCGFFGCGGGGGGGCGNGGGGGGGGHTWNFLVASGSGGSGSGAGGGTTGCGFFNGPCASAPAAGGSVNLLCSDFPNLWYCTSGGFSTASPSLVPSDPATANLGELLQQAGSGTPSLADVVNSVVAFGPLNGHPGFPKLAAPSVSILTPTEGQTAGSFVQVSGVVSDRSAGIKVNGQPLPVVIGSTQGQFVGSIPTPPDGVITVQAANTWGVVSSQIVTVTVNGRPTAGDDFAETTDSTPVSIAVLANDTDPDTDALHIVTITGPARGTARIEGSAIRYVPNGALVGIDTFSYVAADPHGGSATATVTVLVRDRTAPALVVPADAVVEAERSNGATFTYVASAHDSVDGVVPSTCAPVSGSTFPIGPTFVSCTATDSAGNTAKAGFNVIVADTIAPAISCSGDVVVEATSGAGAAATFGASATDAVDTTPAVSCSPASGGTFSLGTTRVTCRAVDDTGNTKTCGLTVTVRDTTAPALNVPSNSIAAAQTAAGTMASYVVTAIDAVDANPTVTCSPPSGSLFPPGVTAVDCTTSDHAGNSAKASFTVRVTYGFDGFFAPIANGGASVFKSGRTVPTTFRLTTADGSRITAATATIHVFRFTDVVLGTHEEITPDAAGGHNTDNLFRVQDDQYTYNLKTTGYPVGTYLLRAVVSDGSTHDVQISIR
jgi:sugar lactone lactonase YvrE